MDSVTLYEKIPVEFHGWAKNAHCLSEENRCFHWSVFSLKSDVKVYVLCRVLNASRQPIEHFRDHHIINKGCLDHAFFCSQNKKKVSFKIDVFCDTDDGLEFDRTTKKIVLPRKEYFDPRPERYECKFQVKNEDLCLTIIRSRNKKNDNEFLTVEFYSKRMRKMNVKLKDIKAEMLALEYTLKKADELRDKGSTGESYLELIHIYAKKKQLVLQDIEEISKNEGLGIEGLLDKIQHKKPDDNYQDLQDEMRDMAQTKEWGQKVMEKINNSKRTTVFWIFEIVRELLQ